MPFSIASPAGLGEICNGNGADADDNKVGCQFAAVGKRHAHRVGIAGNRRYAGPGADVDAGGAMAFGDDGGDLLRNPAHQHARLRLDDGHRRAAFRSTCGKLEPDEAAANDDEPHTGRKQYSDAERVIKTPQRHAPLPCIGRQRQLPRDGAGRQEKLVIGQRRAVREPDRLSGAVDPNRPPPGQHRNALLDETAGQPDPFRLRLFLAVQRLLGERRTLIRQMHLFADQRHRPGKTVFAQREGGAGAALPRPDDHHSRPAVRCVHSVFRSVRPRTARLTRLACRTSWCCPKARTSWRRNGRGTSFDLTPLP